MVMICCRSKIFLTSTRTVTTIAKPERLHQQRSKVEILWYAILVELIQQKSKLTIVCTDKTSGVANPANIAYAFS